MKNIVWVFMLFFLSACNKKQYIKYGDTSMTSLDWAGMYFEKHREHRGVKIERKIVLHEDLTYQMTVNGKYSEGEIVWADNGSDIALAGQQFDGYFKVVENAIVEITEKGVPLTNGAVRLQKQETDTGIQEKYWKLVKIGDKKIDPMDNEPHFILKDNLEYKGSGGCNNLNGKYELNENDQKIKFWETISTKMACENLQTENLFLQALQKVNGYSINSDVLFLKDGGKIIARLDAVYLR